MSLSGYTNTPILPEKAKELMSLDTEYKEIITYGKIEEWFTAWDGKVYVSFSGGKDSTVLAYLVANWLSHFRTPPWPLNLVFVNTGLEYPGTLWHRTARMTMTRRWYRARCTARAVSARDVCSARSVLISKKARIVLSA